MINGLVGLLFKLGSLALFIGIGFKLGSLAFVSAGSNDKSLAMSVMETDDISIPVTMLLLKFIFKPEALSNHMKICLRFNIFLIEFSIKKVHHYH